jgi:hypothetical protein
MSPPAELSAEMRIATARMPAVRLAASSEASALASFSSRIGSPATKRSRTTEPPRVSGASGRAARVMKPGLTAFSGQGCQRRFSGPSFCPWTMSADATRTSVVGAFTASAIDEVVWGSDWTARASHAARPPAPSAPMRMRIRSIATDLRWD